MAVTSMYLPIGLVAIRFRASRWTLALVSPYAMSSLFSSPYSKATSFNRADGGGVGDLKVARKTQESSPVWVGSDIWNLYCQMVQVPHNGTHCLWRLINVLG